MYEKPEVKVIEVSKEDIIQTSLDPTTGPIIDKPMEFSLTSQSDATGNVFQK